MKNILLEKNFYKKAKNLRQFFDLQFIDPREMTSKRFVWDYWHVPDQYTLLRTPAYHYFPEKLYQDFHSQLVQWGRENLGCHDVSPPWMSIYINGCKQELHSDVPHGPWAFVYSLTLWSSRRFTGGETLILKPETLNYWKHFSDQKEYELSSVVDRVPSHFNQLTVFDPRFPHGVTEVKGETDPRFGRLVIHGWFVEPRPYVVGALSTKDVDLVLKNLLYSLESKLRILNAFHGTVSLQIDISNLGEVVKAKFLTNTLRSTSGLENEERILKNEILKLIRHAKFPKRKSKSKVVLPLVFKQ